MKITTQERTALLKARYAGRYDNLGARLPYPKDEAVEENAVTRMSVPRRVYVALVERGLLAFKNGNEACFRLTDAGRDALKAS